MQQELDEETHRLEQLLAGTALAADHEMLLAYLRCWFSANADELRAARIAGSTFLLVFSVGVLAVLESPTIAGLAEVSGANPWEVACVVTALAWWLSRRRSA
jgi:hypothetical protein